jgi:hypothetical protein
MAFTYLGRQLAGKRARHIIQRGFTGRIGDVLVAAALYDIIGEMDNIASGMPWPRSRSCRAWFSR